MLSLCICHNLPVMYAFIECDVTKECSEEVIVFTEKDASSILADSQDIFWKVIWRCSIPHKMTDNYSNYFTLQSKHLIFIILLDYALVLIVEFLIYLIILIVVSIISWHTCWLLLFFSHQSLLLLFLFRKIIIEEWQCLQVVYLFCVVARPIFFITFLLLKNFHLLELSRVYIFFALFLNWF